MKLRNFLNLKFVTKLQKLPHGCEKNRLILNLQFRVQKWQAWVKCTRLPVFFIWSKTTRNVGIWGTEIYFKQRFKSRQFWLYFSRFELTFQVIQLNVSSCAFLKQVFYLCDSAEQHLANIKLTFSVLMYSYINTSGIRKTRNCMETRRPKGVVFLYNFEFSRLSRENNVA